MKKCRRSFRFGILAGLAVLLGAGALLPARAAAAGGKPNVLFIIADDMQRSMFNCLPEGKGKNLTPNLDWLASEGTLMMGQHVSSPVCTPSRFSCLTGRYASRSRSAALLRTIERDGQSVITWNTHILPDEMTLPKLLKKAGYVTGMVGKNHVIDASGFTKAGYREDPRDPQVKARLQANQQQVRAAVRKAGFDYAASIYHNNPDGNGPRAVAVHNLDWIAQGALEFIDRNHDKPFFLYFASTVPHGPGSAERSWNADPRATAEGFLDEPLRVLPPRSTIPRRLEKAGLPVDNTRANVLWLDDAVGALLDKLKQHGVQRNTLVFFFNDHGQAAKGTLYQGGVTDPSIVWRQGGFPCGGAAHAAISNIDFAPTILDFAGLGVAGAEIPAGHFDGKSFRPVLEGKADRVHESLYFEMGFTRAVIKGNWKYLALRYPERARRMSLDQRSEILTRFNAKQREHTKRIVTTDPSAPFSHISLIPGGGGAEAASTGKYPAYYDADQLYDLSADPDERTNLADVPQHAGKLEEMQQELRKHLDRLPGGFAELKPVE